MKKIQTNTLEIAYLEFGPSDGIAVILLHGFPYDVNSYTNVAQQLAAKGMRCFVPYLRGFGPTKFLDTQTMRSGQQAALGADLLAFMDVLNIDRAILGGYDWGGRAACIVSALWPERVIGLVSCGLGYNIQDIPNAWRPAPPEEEIRYWYIYYFNTRRGKTALINNRNDLCHYIWTLWSPTWKFDQATYTTTSRSFENPDFVEIVIHSYMHRLGDLDGDSNYNEIESQLAKKPSISVPSIVLQGSDDTVDPPSDDDPDAKQFTGSYQRIVVDGVGHNLPQEAPEAFAVAVQSLVG